MQYAEANLRTAGWIPPGAIAAAGVVTVDGVMVAAHRSGEVNEGSSLVLFQIPTSFLLDPARNRIALDEVDSKVRSKASAVPAMDSIARATLDAGDLGAWGPVRANSNTPVS